MPSTSRGKKIDPWYCVGVVKAIYSSPVKKNTAVGSVSVAVPPIIITCGSTLTTTSHGAYHY